MKSLGPKIIIAVTVVASPREIPMPSHWSQNSAQRIASFTGQIMDSTCATTGAHGANMKELDAKDARGCTLRCAKNGSFVLYDPETKTVYQLNNQEKPLRCAGERVNASGRYDDWSQTIEIESIEPAP